MTATPAGRPITVRSASPRDATDIAAVTRAAATRAYTFVPEADLAAWLNVRADVATIAHRVGANYSAGGLYLAAVRANTFLGAGLIRPESAGVGHLDDLYVDPPGRGVGTLILNTLLAHAQTRWQTVHCFVPAPNSAAVEFFSRHQFHQTGRQPNTELPGDLIEMTRTLRP